MFRASLQRRYVEECRQWGTVHTGKERPVSVTTAKPEGSVLPGMLPLALSSTSDGKALAKRTRVYIDRIEHSKNRAGFLKGLEENDQKKTVQPTPASPPREARLRDPVERSPGSGHDGGKKKKGKEGGGGQGRDFV